MQTSSCSRDHSTKPHNPFTSKSPEVLMLSALKHNDQLLMTLKFSLIVCKLGPNRIAGTHFASPSA
jgi:hypothetical protein